LWWYAREVVSSAVHGWLLVLAIINPALANAIV